jgi:hypothetical protein
VAFRLHRPDHVHRRDGRAVILFAENVADKRDDHFFSSLNAAISLLRSGRFLSGSSFFKIRQSSSAVAIWASRASFLPILKRSKTKRSQLSQMKTQEKIETISLKSFLAEGLKKAISDQDQSSRSQATPKLKSGSSVNFGPIFGEIKAVMAPIEFGNRFLEVLVMTVKDELDR